MRRVIALLAVLCALAVPAAAQQNSKFKNKVTKQPSNAVCKPVISIAEPAATGSVSTSASSVELAGTAAPGVCGEPIVQVTWSSAATSGNGIATGQSAWEVRASAGSAVRFEDNLISPGSSIDLTSHAPDVVGDSWVLNYTNSTSNYCKLVNADGSAGMNASDLVAGKLALCEAVPTTPLSGTDYDIEWTMAALSGSTTWGVFFGGSGTDGQNLCAVMGSSSSQNPDLYLVTRTAGTGTNISAPVNIGPLTSNTWRLERRGTSLNVFRNDVSVLTGTSACNAGTKFGLVFGDAGPTSVGLSTSMRIGSLKVTDQGASTPAISLNNGANVITVTALDAAGHSQSAVIVVTKTGVADTTNPTVSIVEPSDTGSFSTNTATHTLSGTAADNSGVVDHETYSCTGATTLSGTTAVGGLTWSQDLTFNTGTTTCVIKSFDVAGNQSAGATIVLTVNLADATNPVISLVSPAGPTFDAGTGTSVNVSGTASDNVAVTALTWTNSLGGSGTMSGALPFSSGTWLTSVPLAVGTNVLTFKAQDGTGNQATVQLSVTSAPALAFTTAATLPAMTTGVAGPGFQLSATGGSGTKTYDNNAGGTALVGANCGGITVSSAGVVGGTPSAGAGNTCNSTLRVTDASGSATKAFSISIVAAGNGPHDFFNNTLLTHPNLWKALSLRPLVGHPCLTTTAEWCGDAYYTDQLNGIYGSAGGAVTYNGSANPATPTGDTDPHKQDAGKMTIRPFISTTSPHINYVGAGGLDASQLTWVAAGPGGVGTADDNSAYNDAGRTIKIDNEMMIMQRYDRPTRTFTVSQRGAHGTTATTHAQGAVIVFSNNNAEGEPFLPLNTADGNTYFLTWDVMWTDSLLGSGQTNYKWFNIRSSGTSGSGGIWLELNTAQIGDTSANVGICGGTSTYTPGVDIGVFKFRSYNITNTTIALWTDTNGDQTGIGTTGGDVVCPQVGQFVIRTNTWMRVGVRIQQRANDFDIMDAWLADESHDAVRTHSGLLISVGQSLNAAAQVIRSLQLEYNTSNNDYDRNPTCNKATVTPDYACNLVSYIRNVAVLRTSGLAAGSALDDASIAALMIRPRRDP